MKKVPNILLQISPVNAMSQSIYEYDDEHYVASYLKYVRSTEYWGSRDIHTWKLVWIIVDKTTLKSISDAKASRKEVINNFEKYKNKAV